MMINKRTALATAGLSLIVATAGAQQAGHQMAGMATGSAGGAAMCAQNSESVTRTIDVVNARIEDVRQTNDASKLRTAIADLQSVFAQMKTQLADCVALAREGGGAAGSMPGMDHSKMNMAPGTPVMQPGSATPAPGAAMPGMDHAKMQMTPKPAAKPSGSGASVQQGRKRTPAAGMDHSKMPSTPAAKVAAAEPDKMAGMDHSKMTADNAAAAPAVVFTMRTDPAPPRIGKNSFEVTLKDAAGRPVADADVSLAFYLPAMPSMNMPAMQSAAQLTSAGNGVYKGGGTVGMAGDWDVTITAARKGQTLATKKVRLTAK